MNGLLYKTTDEQREYIMRNYYRLCIVDAWDSPNPLSDEALIGYADRLKTIYLSTTDEVPLYAIANALVQNGRFYTDAEILEHIQEAK